VLEVMGQMPETVLARAELVKFGHACEKSPNLTDAQCWKHPRPMRPQRTSNSHSPAGSPTFDKRSAGGQHGQRGQSKLERSSPSGGARADRVARILRFDGCIRGRISVSIDSRFTLPRRRLHQRGHRCSGDRTIRSTRSSRDRLTDPGYCWPANEQFGALLAGHGEQRLRRGARAGDSSTARCDRHTG
jgi:hypothetical protein